MKFRILVAPTWRWHAALDNIQFNIQHSTSNIHTFTIHQQEQHAHMHTCRWVRPVFEALPSLFKTKINKKMLLEPQKVSKHNFPKHADTWHERLELALGPQKPR